MSQFVVDPIILDTNQMQLPTEGKTIYESRDNAFEACRDINAPIATVLITAYNRLQKTKNCVESVLKYSDGIDYELILVDNGSESDMMEYFKSIEHPQKKIIRVTKNIGGGYPTEHVLKIYRGKYLVAIANDVIVTKNWLSNLITCMESDDSIGFATPLSSNISNFQDPGYRFSDFNELQLFGEHFNVSDKLKWEERCRLVAVAAVYRRSALSIVGFTDKAFFHDFSDDDLSIRFRRAGYKLILCGDTFIHHDHDFANLEDKDPVEYQMSIKLGRALFENKYKGIDAWDDVSNYEQSMVSMLGTPNDMEHKRILGIDVRCGEPILDIKNYLRKQNVLDITIDTFTTQAKYYNDLLTVSDKVICDRIEYLLDDLEDSYDYIILGETLNSYIDLQKLIKNIYKLTAKGGTILISLENTNDIQSYLMAHDLSLNIEHRSRADFSALQLHDYITLLGVDSIDVTTTKHNVAADVISLLENALRNSKLNSDIENIMDKLMTKEYKFCIRK